MLVLEDLVAAGFVIQRYTETISTEDAVSNALADLHAIKATKYNVTRTTTLKTILLKVSIF
jgi:hypothetical protein